MFSENKGRADKTEDSPAMQRKERRKKKKTKESQSSTIRNMTEERKPLNENKLKEAYFMKKKQNKTHIWVRMAAKYLAHSFLYPVSSNCVAPGLCFPEVVRVKVLLLLLQDVRQI